MKVEINFKSIPVGKTSFGTITRRFNARNPAETNPPRRNFYVHVFPNDESIREGYCNVYIRCGVYRIGRLTTNYDESVQWANQAKLVDQPVYRLRIKNIRKPVDKPNTHI